MPSKRILKKDVNDIMAFLIDQCYMVELLDNSKSKKVEKLVDEIVNFYNETIFKINDKNVENIKKHYKVLREDIDKNVKSIAEKIEKLAA